LIFGIGAGGHLVADPAGTVLVRREHEAYGLPLVSAGEAVGALGETLAIVRRMWSEDEPFDFAGRHYQLQGAICEPKPVQRPGPPILLAACGERVALRLAAEHASLWICPTGDVEEFKRKSELLDQHCRALGRDPSKIGRLQQFIVSPDHAASTVSQMRAFAAAGCTHLVIAPRPPLPSAQELVERIVEPVLAG
jgi:alkanesulfonate monooxygenase SsuD/methylene tetrahydromethanopterin reductase-like flavin-dependent oxidoreductase (luciferase family)